MPDLFLHARKLESVFELLGAKENDITYSIGWALSPISIVKSANLLKDIFEARLS
jgi:3-methyladenine DNA glycosylase AlkD